MSRVEREQGQGPAPLPRGRRREGAVWSVRQAHEQGSPPVSGAGAMEAGSGRARGAEQRSEERRGSGQGGPSGRERGHVGCT
jgi:hypothetical protein